VLLHLAQDGAPLQRALVVYELLGRHDRALINDYVLGTVPPDADAADALQSIGVGAPHGDVGEDLRAPTVEGGPLMTVTGQGRQARVLDLGAVRLRPRIFGPGADDRMVDVATLEAPGDSTLQLAPRRLRRIGKGIGQIRGRNLYQSLRNFCIVDGLLPD